MIPMKEDKYMTLKVMNQKKKGFKLMSWEFQNI